MLCFLGRRKRPNVFPSTVACRRRPGLRWALAVSAFVPLAMPAQAQGPLTLAEAERLALTEEPGREIFLARSAALAERSIAAGQLMDPKARVGLLNFPIESGGFSTEGMTQVQLGIRQEFPRGNSRALRTERLLAEAAEQTARAELRSRDVLTAVRQAWLDAYYWTQAAALVGESRPLFDDLAAITQSLYAVGRRDQQDVLRADLELSRLDDRLLQIETQRLAAQGALQEWIGLAARRPVSAALPNWPTPPEFSALEAALAEHPDLTAAAARVTTQEHAIELAEAQFKPGWMLDFGYGYREGNLPSGEPRSDFISLMVSVDVPLFRRNRQSRDLEAALQERRAAEASQSELTRRLTSQLQREYDRWKMLSQRIALYDDTILVQADDRARAALLAYQSESGDFSDVLRGYIDQLNARLEHVRLQVERARSFAVLAHLGGITP